MISPQHLINTGICGLFCVTLFSLASIKPETQPVMLSRPLPIAPDYTLHIKTNKVEQRIYTPVIKYESHQGRSLEQRNEEARANRRQFEGLFTRSSLTRNTENLRETTAVTIVHPEEPSVILKRARKAVYHGIEMGISTREAE